MSNYNHDDECFFETMSKRRKGFPSETHVKRGVRVVGGDKLLDEMLVPEAGLAERRRKPVIDICDTAWL